MRGNNQGIVKIATGGVPKADDVEELRVVKENKCGALLSGGHSMVATARAADMAVDLAEKHGVGVVGINHGSASSGAIGYYSRQIAMKGCVGFVCTGSTLSLVAPDPGLLAGKDEFMKRSTELVEHVKSAKPLPGKQVMLPGERGDTLAKQAEDSGKIEIADAIWQELGSFVAS